MPNNPYRRSYAFDIVKDARDARNYLKKLAMKEKGQETMARRRRALIVVVSTYINCPYCDTEIEEPSTGSLQWTLYNIETQQGEITCPSCGEVSELPKNLRSEVWVNIGKVGKWK